MPEPRVYKAVIADMDGVLTRTASLHLRAWTQTFDAFLVEYGRRTGAPQAPFSERDYQAHVDGKPRYDGVADFLAARGIALERGQPADPPSAETVHGLGNRKNQRFLDLLEHEGAEQFADAVVAFERWRRGGLKLAVVSASRNCKRVLESIESRVFIDVDVIVDGTKEAELLASGKPGGKRGLMLEAARRLGVEVGEAVVLEDAESGVQAAREAGFGLVVGVDREGHGDALTRAGAHQLVGDLYALRFCRRVPSALDRRDELARWQGDRALAVFLDFDGTLSPIVRDPAAAALPEPTRSSIAALAERCHVAIVSGRDRPDVEARVGLTGLIYAGGHGFDIAGRGHKKTLPEAEAAVPGVEHAEQQLHRALADIPGAIVERKRFSVAAHYRQVDDPRDVEAIRACVETLARETGLRMRTGKMVLELEPALEWHKGRAVDWILSVLEIDRARESLIYIGDDETDEDVFATMHGSGSGSGSGQGDGIGVRVGSELTTSLADYRVADPDEVRELLAWLVERCPGS